MVWDPEKLNTFCCRSCSENKDKMCALNNSVDITNATGPNCLLMCIGKFFCLVLKCHIWVRFPRTGILAKLWSLFEKSKAFMRPKLMIFVWFCKDITAYQRLGYNSRNLSSRHFSCDTQDFLYGRVTAAIFSHWSRAKGKGKREAWP